MGVASNASAISGLQRKYVAMFHEVLMRYSVSYGKESNFAQLVPKLMRNDGFRVEFSMLVQWIQKLEEGHLALDQMLEIIWIAVTGSVVVNHMDSGSGPLMIFLSGLGGWPDSDDREASPKSAPPVSDSESGTPFGNSASIVRKDEPHEGQDKGAAVRRRLMLALWLLPVLPLVLLCVALYRNYAGRTDVTPTVAITNQAPAVDKVEKPSRRSGRASLRRQPNLEDGGEIETLAPAERVRDAWPTSGFVVIGENGRIRFDKAGRIITAPAKIHPQKPEPAPTITEAGARMPAIVPEAIVTMSYPTVVTREAPRTEPPRTETASAAPIGELITFASSDKGRIADEERARTTATTTESSAPVVMPVVVASASPPPVATVARTESRSIPLKGLSSAKPFELVRPRVAVSAGLLSADIVKFQMPKYPKSARRQMLQGDVLVRVLISDKGKIVRALALNGPQTFREAAEKAVHHWRYVPYIVNGKPVEVQTWVTFHFELRES